MITLNDYLYNGDTVLKILHNYIIDLRIDAKKTGNSIDMIHCNMLLQMTELLEHNDFLTSQSQRIREFYKFMCDKYSTLAFTFKGRIKSLIRAEEKFNGYIVEYVCDYYEKNGTFPSETEVRNRLVFLRDMIAYRIIISMPKCHLDKTQDRREVELKYLYEIANQLPQFLEERGFNAEQLRVTGKRFGEAMDESVRPYYKDYIVEPTATGYESLHITFFDVISRNYLEVQLRTKEMDDFAEIGKANHLNYEKIQEISRTKRNKIPVGKCKFFDEAYERVVKLQELELKDIDVNMFAAANNTLVNDGCGLFRGRLILPYEHLSRFQNDLID